MTWPSTNVPATAPTDHGDVRTQAYQAGGGDYFRSGYYSLGLFASQSSTTLAMGVTVFRCRPFAVPVRRSFDRIGGNVTAAATAGGVLRFGVYTIAGALVVDAGTLDATTTGVKQAVVSLTLDPGIYLVGAVSQVAGATLTAFTADSSTPWVSPLTTPPANLLDYGGLAVTGVSGALPSTATLLALSNTPSPAVCLRAA